MLMDEGMTGGYMLDFFGKNASDLRDKRLWLLDMDGTIYQEEQIFEGTLDFLRAITDSGGEIYAKH